MAETKKQWLAEIGARVRGCRERLGITQADMADWLALRPESYNYIENGKRDMKTAELASLAERLQVTSDYLLTGYAPENASTAKALHLSDKSVNALKGMSDRTAYAVNRLLESQATEEIAFNLCAYQAHTACTLYYQSAPAEELEKLFHAPARANMQRAAALLENAFKPMTDADYFKEEQRPRKDIEIDIEKMIEEMPEDRLQEMLELLEFVFRQGGTA